MAETTDVVAEVTTKEAQSAGKFIQMTNDKKSNNVCSRCGKLRVVARTYQETVGISVVTYTEMSCPDSLCQGLVEKNLQVEANKRKVLKDDKEKRDAERKLRIASEIKNRKK